MEILTRRQKTSRDKVQGSLKRPLKLTWLVCLLGFLLPQWGAAQQISPNFVNIDTYSGSANDVTVTMPSGSIVGDVVLVYVVQDDDDAAIVDESGVFTQLYNLTGSANGPRSALFYKVINGTEAASYIFDLNVEPGVVTTLRYRGLDAAMPFLANNGVQGNSNAPTAPSVSTTINNITYLHFIGIDGSSAGMLNATSGTATVEATAESSNANGHVEMMITSELQSSSGVTPTGVFSFDSSEEWTAITLALNYSPVQITSPADGQCITAATTLTADYQVSSSSGDFELVDPSGTVVATESYASTSGTISFNFTPTLTGNYIVREQAQNELNNFITIYVDTDGDTICDLFDMDDDNDGVRDDVESPNCFSTVNPFNAGDRTGFISVTTEWTFNNGTLSNILDGDTNGNAVSRTNGDFIFSGQEFLHFTLSEAVTFEQIIFYHEGTIFLDADLVGVVQGSNNGTTWTDLTVPGGLLLDDAASPYTLNLTQNMGDYTQYRVVASGGRIDDDEFLREIEFTTQHNPLDYPLATCPDDIDNDLLKNHLDLDSDGDGCSDALEGGATMSTTADFQFPIGDSGANGLPNAVETFPESGIISYTLTYIPDAIFSGITGCIDRDGDSVVDANDQDTDNDGLTDVLEDGYCNIDYNLAANKSQIQISSNTGTSGDINVLLNGNTGDNSFYYTNSAWAGDEIVRLQFPLATILTGLEFWITNSFMMDLNTVVRIQGSNDGSTWEEMSPVAEYVRVAPDNTPGVLSAALYANTLLWENTIPYTYYRILGVSGGGNPTPWVNELYFRTDSPVICDYDGDGIPNSADLDSDGDGIPDNVEAQSTLGYVAPNADSQATYAGNGGINSAYLGGIFPTDTDTDGLPDFLDTDSDADQKDDVEESGLPFTGIPAPNGLDMGVKTSDDYSDVNGIVNNPDTDLAKVTTTTNEVDFRDKEPPVPIKVCHTSGAYNLGGTWFTFADDKLLNPANFGDNGIARIDFTLHSFGTSTITEAALLAEGCQIFQTQQTNEFNAQEHIEIGNWAQAMDHVLLTSEQNVVYIVGPEYPNSGGNSNPNNLTEVGENVVNGPFGTILPFSQGGSYQGAFDAYPDEDACVIIEDAQDRPTGLLNRTTGDFYLADADLLSELGGLE